MGLFDDMLKGGESLFLDTIALDVDYVPGVIKHREQEQHYIATCIKPLLQKRSGKNLLVHGSPGIGKTVAVKHVLQELGNETDAIETIYVNCWKKETAHKIALEICQQIGFSFIHNKDTTDLFREIAKILNKKAAVIVLDEADKIVGDEIFYTMMEDIFRKSLIFITNEGDWLSKLDKRVRSRIMPDVIEFKPYSHDEVRDILKERVEYAFVPGVVGGEVIAVIADATFKTGDIRAGLFLLKEAGEIAEGKSLKKVLLEHAEVAKGKLQNFHIKKPSTLTEDEQKILSFIQEHVGKTGKQIYDLFSQDETMSYSSFQRKIKNLEKGKFISLKKVNEGQPGVSTLVMMRDMKLDEF